MAGAFAAQSDDSEADVQVRLTGDSWGWRWSAERAAAAPPELTLGLEGPGGRLPSAAAGRAVSAWSAPPAPATASSPARSRRVCWSAASVCCGLAART